MGTRRSVSSQEHMQTYKKIIIKEPLKGRDITAWPLCELLTKRQGGRQTDTKETGRLTQPRGIWDGSVWRSLQGSKRILKDCFPFAESCFIVFLSSFQPVNRATKKRDLPSAEQAHTCIKHTPYIKHTHTRASLTSNHIWQATAGWRQTAFLR